MNSKRATQKVTVTTVLAVVTGLLICIMATEAGAQGYVFANDSQGWRYMGLYDGGDLTPLRGFVIGDNPWTGVDGDGGAILLGQEGFNTPRSPSLETFVHGDLNSSMLFYEAGRTVRLSWGVTGSHMRSTKKVFVQAVLLVTLANGRERFYASEFHAVPIGEDGDWDTHTFIQQLPARTIVKQINMRVFFETASLYNGWIMLDNVVLN